jgi:hypothetical protein
MRYPDTMPLQSREDLSRGFSRGNYGNAYESQDWETWSESLDGESIAYRNGALLGFFSSYELDEIGDEILSEEVAALRATYDPGGDDC